MRVGFHIKELLSWSALVKLTLNRIQLARLEELPPLGIGEHFVTVIILQSIRIESLQIADVGVLAFAHEAHQIIFLIKPVGITEGFITPCQILGADTLT